MKDFFRHYVVHNFGLKLISLAFAAGLWLAVAQDHQAEVPIEVPIEFSNVPENLEISSEHIPQVQIRLRGAERLMRRLQRSDVDLRIDLSGVKAGERTFDLSAEQVHHPYDLEVVSVVPSQLHLAFDTRLTRQVEVHPRVVGTFAAGYSIGRIVVDPPAINITGPRKRVEAVETAITDPVDVSGTMQRATFVTHAYVPDPMVQVVDPAPIRVTVIMEKASGASGAR
jgi:YbbR domain-containing protein